MTPEVFAEWLRRQGKRVVQSASSFWHDAGPRALQAFPYHWLIEPSESELLKLLRHGRALVLRYSAPLESSVGRVSYHAVYSHTTYELSDLGCWARKNVRRGLRHCRVEPISPARLATEGWALRQDTLERQGRGTKLSFTAWQTLCRAAVDLPGFECWGALVRERLAASAITFRMEECCYLLYQQCHRDFLRDHVNNALVFVVTQMMIRRPGVKSIFYGLHSLDAPASVDQFKLRMGYTARAVRQRVVLHPWLVPLVNRVTHGLIRGLSFAWRGGTVLSKTEGLIRFYLEGKRPLHEQGVPPALARAHTTAASKVG